MTVTLVLRAAVLMGVAAAACRRAIPPSPSPSPVVGAAAQRSGIELSAEGVANAGIQTARASSEAFGPRLTATAAIEADPQHVARVGSRVAGRVTAIDVRLGDTVRRGQALVEIDAVELHQVALEYFTARARTRQAEDVLARQRQLVTERVGAVQDLRRAEADSAAFSAALHESEEHLHFLGLTERDITALRDQTSHGEARSTLRAPIDGRVAALDVSLGQVLNGTEDLATITRLDLVWASLRVYERDLANVTPGTSVEVRVPPWPQRVFPGVVSFVGDLVDPVTRTVEARAALSNPDGMLRPGMSATASVALRGREAALWLPVEAVQPHAPGEVVFVRTGPRRFAPRAVVVGPEQGGYVPVTAGLSPGEEVVVRGAFALRGELERAELEE